MVVGQQRSFSFNHTVADAATLGPNPVTLTNVACTGSEVLRLLGLDESNGPQPADPDDAGATGGVGEGGLNGQDCRTANGTGTTVVEGEARVGIRKESSVNGSKGAFGQTNYSAAKAGVHGFTKALALEVAKKNVTVNTISPGYIGTKMVMAIPKEVLDSKILPQIPLGRLGKPEEVAGLIIYLASEEAAFVTGANIAINGGQHMQ